MSAIPALKTLAQLLSGLLLATTLGAADKPEAKPGVDALAWLAGSWEFEKSGRVVREVWMAPGGGTMLGMSRTVKGGKTLEYEFLQIRGGPGGDLFYVAQPSRQKESAFQLKEMTPNSVVFENLAHDFPQRISYTLRADGTLLATIEGPGNDGAARRIEFSFSRLRSE